MLTINHRRYTSLRFLTIAIAAALLVLAGSCCNRQATTPPTGPAPAESAVGSAESFSFIVCGDPQNNYEIFDKVLDAAKSVDFLIIAGDLTGSGTRIEFENFTDKMESSQVSYYCVPGNHDIATSPVDDRYRTFLGPPYRSFDHKNSHFVLIDNSTPELGFYPNERKWVENDLNAAKKRGFDHIFAVCHVAPGHPYSGKFDLKEVAGVEANEFLVPVLNSGAVEELFCGHMHTYETWDEDGLTITVTGGAGAPLHRSPAYGGYHHYVLVTVTGGRREQKVVRI